jgi:hypothetical protein
MTSSGLASAHGSLDEATAPLAAAGELLTAGACGQALDQLLAAWRHCKAAEIADLIDTLGGWIDGGLPKVEGKRTTIDAHWRDIADQLRSIDVGRLTAALDLGTARQVEGWGWVPASSATSSLARCRGFRWVGSHAACLRRRQADAIAARQPRDRIHRAPHRPVPSHRDRPLDVMLSVM